MFVKQHQVSLKDAANSTDESVFHPLPALFRLLGLSPFQKVSLGCYIFLLLLGSFYISGIFNVNCVFLLSMESTFAVEKSDSLVSIK